MIRTEASTTIECPVQEAWSYISNGDHLDKWFLLRPGEKIKKTSEGPIAMSSTVQLTGQFARQNMAFEARVTEFEPEKKITIEYTSGSFKGSRKTYRLEPGEAGGKTRLVHINEGEFHGFWKVLEFLLRPMARGGLMKTTKEELDKISQGVSSAWASDR